MRSKPDRSRDQRSSWAVDDPEAVRGQRKGPNEHIAQVVSLCAPLR